MNIRPSRFPLEKGVPFGPAISPTEALAPRNSRHIGTFGVLYQMTDVEELAIFDSLPINFVRGSREVLLTTGIPDIPVYRCKALIYYDPRNTASLNKDVWTNKKFLWQAGLMQMRATGVPEWYLSNVYRELWGCLPNKEPLFFPPLEDRITNAELAGAQADQPQPKRTLTEAARNGDRQAIWTLSQIASINRERFGSLGQASQRPSIPSNSTPPSSPPVIQNQPSTPEASGTPTRQDSSSSPSDQLSSPSNRRSAAIQNPTVQLKRKARQYESEYPEEAAKRKRYNEELFRI